MLFNKMQIEVHGSLVTIQYYTKCTDPLYPKFTSKKFRALKFCWNLYQVIAYVLIPTTEKKLTPIYNSFPLIIGQLLQQKYTDLAYPGKFDHNCNKTFTTSSKLGTNFWRRTSDDFRASHYGIQAIKMGFNHFWTFVTFPYRGLNHLASHCA